MNCFAIETHRFVAGVKLFRWKRYRRTGDNTGKFTGRFGGGGGLAVQDCLSFKIQAIADNTARFFKGQCQQIFCMIFELCLFRKSSRTSSWHCPFMKTVKRGSLSLGIKILSSFLFVLFVPPFCFKIILPNMYCALVLYVVLPLHYCVAIMWATNSWN